MSFDRRRVWTDTWAFEHLLGRVNSVPLKSLDEEHGQLVEKALALYKGHFLEDDLDAVWAMPLREKLRSRFLRCLEKFGQVLERKQQWQRALEWYRRGLETDLLAEQFYQRLMVCYDKVDRKSDAVEVYRQCFKILMTNLGVEPSTITKNLYKQITH